ncbi:LON peptidase substrate-binding domain-containing protein [Variovorax sp. PCZ-1]|uniref:LON peptidase substrate-binding domain-containing protein n=1 Tax=Variovorax sp. PCZ-1 TaxID=2835533 RepID=UPI0032DFAC88
MVLNNLPLFPLGSVLFPGSVLPLRIFEVRYLDMIRRCIENGAPFGIVSLTKGHEVVQPGQSEAFAQVGTLATITHHESPQPGLRVIRCLGQQRFRTSRIERLKHGLWVADVSYLAEDNSIPVPEELSSCRRLFESVLARMPETTQVDLFPGPATEAQLSDCSWLANRWCQLLPLPMEMKQRLLELDSPLIRLELVSDLLDKLGINSQSAT